MGNKCSTAICAPCPEEAKVCVEALKNKKKVCVEALLDNIELDVPFGKVLMIACAIGCGLDGAEKIVNLAEKSRGVDTVMDLYNHRATGLNVRRAIEQVWSVCGPQDCFVFFYSGKRAKLNPVSSEESNGQDDAFCLLDADGNDDARDSWLSDTEFANILKSAGCQRAKVVIITDCCHDQMTVGNYFSQPEWEGLEAVHISTCAHAGSLSSLLEWVERFKECHNSDYSIAELCEVALTNHDAGPHASQNDMLQWNSGTSGDMKWPLVPEVETYPVFSVLHEAEASNLVVGEMASHQAWWATRVQDEQLALNPTPALLAEASLQPPAPQDEDTPGTIAHNAILAASDTETLGRTARAEDAPLGRTPSGKQRSPAPQSRRPHKHRGHSWVPSIIDDMRTRWKMRIRRRRRQHRTGSMIFDTIIDLRSET